MLEREFCPSNYRTKIFSNLFLDNPREIGIVYESHNEIYTIQLLIRTILNIVRLICCVYLSLNWIIQFQQQIRKNHNPQLSLSQFNQALGNVG